MYMRVTLDERPMQNLICTTFNSGLNKCGDLRKREKSSWVKSKFKRTGRKKGKKKEVFLQNGVNCSGAVDVCSRAKSGTLHHQDIVIPFQLITSVENLYTQESTVFNPLRAKRPGAGRGATEETKQ